MTQPNRAAHSRLGSKAAIVLIRKLDSSAETNQHCMREHLSHLDRCDDLQITQQMSFKSLFLRIHHDQGRKEWTMRKAGE